jgi:serralysin
LSVDTNGDGTAEYITTFTYDAMGNQLTVGVVTNGNGAAENITTFTYDAMGNKLTESVDTNGDGTAESITTYTQVISTWHALLSGYQKE